MDVDSEQPISPKYLDSRFTQALLEPSSLKELEEWSSNLKNTLQAPTCGTKTKALACVVAFAKKRQRKVYGGFVVQLARNDVSTIATDIEFYSPDAAKDAMELADDLYAAGHRFVQAREANHSDTITVTVDFTRICDITFTPSLIYEAIPTNTWPCDPEVICVTPQFAFIDVMRQIADPVASHWRVGHVLNRLEALQSLTVDILPAFSQERLDEVMEKSSYVSRMMNDTNDTTTTTRRVATHSGEDEVVLQILQKKKSSSLALLGAHGISTLFDDASHHESSENFKDSLSFLDEFMGLTVVSTNFEEDVEWVSEQLVTWFAATKVEYEPFMDLCGRRCVFQNQSSSLSESATEKTIRPILTIIDYAGISVPVIDRPQASSSSSSLSRLDVAAFCYQIKHLLVCSFMSKVMGDQVMETVTAFATRSLVNERQVIRSHQQQQQQEYGLISKKEDDKLRDFLLPVIGTPISSMERHMSWTDSRRQRFKGRNGISIWFKYAPPAAKVNYPFVSRMGRRVTMMNTTMNADSSHPHQRPPHQQHPNHPPPQNNRQRVSSNNSNSHQRPPLPLPLPVQFQVPPRFYHPHHLSQPQIPHDPRSYHLSNLNNLNHSRHSHPPPPPPPPPPPTISRFRSPHLMYQIGQVRPPPPPHPPHHVHVSAFGQKYGLGMGMFQATTSNIVVSGSNNNMVPVVPVVFYDQSSVVER